MDEKLSKKILVVDDLPENTTLLARILTSSGYQVQIANNGPDAIRQAQASRPDLILLDISMPIMDGFETCLQLQQDQRTSAIPVIFISALDDIDNKVRAFQQGGVDYITKPFELEEVQARVGKHLAILHLRAQLQLLNQQLTLRVEELVRSQELLRERESRLDAFIKALPSLSFVIDEEGRYLEVMTNEADSLVIEKTQLLGRLISEITPQQEATVVMDAIKLAIETGKTQLIEYQLPASFGGERWFEGRVALMEKNPDGHSKVVFVVNEISERVKLYREIQRLANQDPLTNCYNRRYFMVLAEHELQRATRYQRPLSLIFLDIDHFKKFNDQYGHQIGDYVLCSLVNLCKKHLRNIDILSRYGGEEFVILMPETDSEGAVQTAERLRLKIENMKIATTEGKLSITISMGAVSLMPGLGKTLSLDELIKHADQALYSAKAAGRNCIKVSRITDQDEP
jgi:diguanylate cyclase (GGDEF)-like protein/PAS domain S-box-containing protein